MIRKLAYSKTVFKPLTILIKPGRIPLRTPEQRLAHNKHLRFFAALALYDVVEEVPLDTVALKYGTHRG